MRPADGKEVAAAYAQALKMEGPSCFALSRQNLPLYENSGKEAMKGGYILSDSEKATPDVILMASGSEVEQAMEAQKLLADEGIDARVVSMPCFTIFRCTERGIQGIRAAQGRARTPCGGSGDLLRLA